MIEIENFLQTTKFLDFDDNWDLAKYTSSIIDTSIGRQVIIHILDIWEDINTDAKSIWLDLVERAGFYPYYVDKIGNNERYKISAQSEIRTQYFRSDYLPNIYFHQKQKEIEIALSSGKNVAVSAPTSFGKSLLIEEIIARKQFDNILIIQPTLALIDETRKKMKKYDDYYNLVVNTRQSAQKNNIFILTAERVLEYENLPKIEFFIIDEFYKISSKREDNRVDALNIALLHIMKNNPQSMFLTPTVDSLSKKFREKYEIIFFKTDYALVNTNVHEIRTKNGTLYSSTEKKKKLFTILEEHTEPSIIYVKSPNEAYKLAKEYLNYLEANNKKVLVNHDLDIYEWMDENVSSEWQLKELLKYGIGAHNGALPRHIVTSEIELFNSGTINVLFATASLIEGVNTVAKNMMIFSQKKGENYIDFFDFSNIRGRAGRMKEHFTGEVYLFIQEPQKEEFTIDVPAIDQKEVSDEILVNIPDTDVQDKKRKEILNRGLDDELKEIIKKNMISIEGQKELYNFLINNIQQVSFLKWNNLPTYDQLWQTLNLGYKFLKSNESGGYAKQKALIAQKLIKFSLPTVINQQINFYKQKQHKDPVNKAIDEVLKFQRNDATFEIPKLLSVIESLQKYVFMKLGHDTYGDYSVFAAKLESEQVDQRFQFLIDYGVPSSAIKKISLVVGENISGDLSIIQYLKENSQTIYPLLLPYERNLLLNTIDN